MRSNQDTMALWMRAMIGRLQWRRRSPEEISQAVSYVEATCQRFGKDPAHHFGQPEPFADSLTFPLDPAQVSPGHEAAKAMGAGRVFFSGVLLIVVMILAAFTGAWTAKAYAEYQLDVTVTAGFVLPFVSIPLLLFGLTRLPVEHMLRRALWYVFLGMALIIAIVVIAVVWNQPLVTIPRETMLVISAVLAVGTTAGFLVAGWLLKRKDEKEMGDYMRGLAGLSVMLTVGLPLFTYFNP